MPFLQADNGEFYYEVKGEGQPLIILRGLARSSRYWLGFENDLAKHYRVIMIDHRGLGQTTVPMKWTDSIWDLAADIYLLMDHLDLPSAHIFGLSLGGMIAMAFAKTYPDRCDSLIVANSSSADSSPLRVNPFTIVSIGRDLVHGSMHKGVQKGVTTPRIDYEMGHEIKKKWDEIRDEEGFPLETMVKQLVAAGRFRVAKQLDGSETKTLILYGNQDKFVPNLNSHRLHKMIPHSRLKAIRGVGHEISIGKPELLVKMIRDFAS